MSSKNGNLLARIDERTANIQKEIKDIKENQREVFIGLKSHHGRLCSIENEHKKTFHTGLAFGILRALGFSK